MVYVILQKSLCMFEGILSWVKKPKITFPTIGSSQFLLVIIPVMIHQMKRFLFFPPWSYPLLFLGLLCGESPAPHTASGSQVFLTLWGEALDRASIARQQTGREGHTLQNYRVSTRDGLTKMGFFEPSYFLLHLGKTRTFLMSSQGSPEFRSNLLSLQSLDI